MSIEEGRDGDLESNDWQRRWNRKDFGMGYDIGWAALNMDMPERIPRTEYSAENHWELVQAVTGVQVSADSPAETRTRAQRAFMEAWDYSFWWSVLVSRAHLNGRVTSMGHAEYAAEGRDFNTDIKCPFSTPEEVVSLDPVEEYGAFDQAQMRDQFEAHHQAMCGHCPDTVNMSGVYITLFSGLIDIFGWDMLLLTAGLDPVGFGRMVRRYEEWITPCFEAYADTDIPVMMVHDDIVWTSGPVLHPDWYREYVFPAYRRMWRPVLDAGKRLVFTSDGDYTLFFDDIVEAGAHALVMEPMCDMAGFAERYGKTHGFIGNADTRILLSGTRPQIRDEVRRCVEIGRECPGFIMAVGNHIPPNTPVENALYYNEVFQEMSRR